MRPTTQRPRSAALLLLLVATAGSAAGLLLTDRSPSAPTRGASAGLTWRAGDTRDYRLTLRSELLMLGATTPIQHDVRALLALRIRSVTPHEVRAEVDLTRVECAIDRRQDRVRERELATTFAVRFSPSGRMLDLDFGTGVRDEIARQLESILRTFEVIVPETDGTARWNSLQRDPSGRYAASYRIEGSSLRTLHKTKLEYVEGTRQLDGEQVVGRSRTKVLESRGRFSLSASGSWIDGATLEERVVTSTEQGPLASVSTRAELGAADTGATAASDAHVRRIAGRSGAAPAGSTVGTPTRAPRALAPAQPTAADVAHFRRAIAAFAEGGGKNMVLLRKLAQWLRDHPTLAGTIPGLLESGLEDRTASGLIHALELAGHAPAQRALSTVLTDPTRPFLHRLRAIVAVGSVARADSETVANLWELATHHGDRESRALASTARLALGQIGGSLRRAGAADYAWLALDLQRAVAVATTNRDRAVALKALGNAGDPAHIESVAAHRTDASPLVRAAAAKALGGIDTAESRAALHDHLTHEREGRVRTAIVRSLSRTGHVDGEGLRLCARMLDTERDPSTRRAMARYLANHLDSLPDARPVLQRFLAAATDRSAIAHVAGRLYRSSP